MRLTLIVISIALCLLLASACSKGINRGIVATVFSIKGTVVFGTAERNNFRPVTLKSRIHTGNTVRSSDGASIDFALIPPVLAQLIGDSEITIDELSIT